MLLQINDPNAFLQKVECYFLDIFDKKVEFNVPSSELFTRMKSIVDEHRNDNMVIKLYGKIENIRTKPSWLDAVSLLFSYKSTKNNENELRIDFQLNYSKDQCREKEVKRFFKYLIYDIATKYNSWYIYPIPHIFHMKQLSWVFLNGNLIQLCIQYIDENSLHGELSHVQIDSTFLEIFIIIPIA